MSRTTIRYGGAALIGMLAVGSLVHPATATATSATIKPAAATPVADAVAALQAAAQQPATGVTPLKLQPVGGGAPTLSHLTIPTIAAATASQGFALRDVLVDAAPDLTARDLDFVLQRQDDQTWTDVHSGTTTGDTDVATVPDLPAGTYRVVFPAQFGMDEFVGEPFVHQPRQLGASISFSAADVRTVIDVNPDPQSGAAYSFRLERKAAGGWESAGDFSTTQADGGHAFKDLASGTYRIVVPDQADALGTVSDEVAVTSAADQKAAAERAAAAERKAAADRQSAAARRAQQQRPAASSPAPVADAPASADGGGIVGTALAQVGDAYRLGATGPDAFDCSGLTSYAYRAAGISIPRTASAQYAGARKVSDPQPGDLVFFLNGAQHVGIYLGNGRMVHAANPGRGVEVTSINSGWYAKTFTGYGRY